MLIDKDNIVRVNHLRECLGAKFKEIELVSADLLNKESIKNAVEDCDYVIHVASPTCFESPKDENVLILPAVQGTLNVLEA